MTGVHSFGHDRPRSGRDRPQPCRRDPAQPLLLAAVPSDFQVLTAITPPEPTTPAIRFQSERRVVSVVAVHVREQVGGAAERRGVELVVSLRVPDAAVLSQATRLPAIATWVA